MVELDFEAIERGTRGHEMTEARLAEALRSRGIEPMEPVAGDPQFDLAWTVGDVLYVAEVKSITPRNTERQLRLGLGQVLRKREPHDPTWAAACAAADVTLIPAPRLERELDRLLARSDD